ncbi:TlyA family RNA methyltransferase [Sporichthya sp.]|uniref:TlyA family RNA methyltransferase n=1 Tax=Sporichthya sp. TaxID=65475 RepID=UPI0017FED79E|nr:TlyA family RNA methyltransferase [Sporichthya sp.]MBA3744878.1 TlyA family RNA methyltransferase [Sporichthya sp.]
MAAPRRLRLDAELVRRGLARSREHASELVAAGRVSVSGRTANKPATQVETADPIVVVEDDDDPGYASRGGHKLAGALDAFEARPDGGPVVAGRVCLDAGASTGGFTDVLLRRDAVQVIAIDVGYGQLAWALQTHERVTVMDRTNIRELAAEDLPARPELVVADLSFISLAKVLPNLAGLPTPDADLVLMVKPQFEIGKERLTSGGVVRDPALRALAVRLVAEAGAPLGLGIRGVTASPLPGPAGNVEYFLWMTAGAPPLDEDDLAAAIAAGPA